MKARTALIATFALACAAFAGEKLVPKTVRAGSALNLQEFGGPDIRLSVKAVYPSSIYFMVSDYTHMIPVTRANLGDANARRGTDPTSNQMMLVPSTASRKVAKKDGKPYGDARSEMFLIYEEPRSKLKVYYADVASAPIDCRELVVSIPEPDSKTEPAPPERRAEEELPKPPAPKTVASKRDPRALPPELALWYTQLQRARESLDLSDAKAVEEFNRQVADYQKALQEARNAKR
jgi:hypothetical protein